MYSVYVYIHLLASSCPANKLLYTNCQLWERGGSSQGRLMMKGCQGHQNSYLTVIGVHSTMQLMYTNYCRITIVYGTAVTHWPLYVYVCI